MNEQTLAHAHILSIITWMPVIGAILLLFFNSQRKSAIRLFANIWAVLCLIPSLFLVVYNRIWPGFNSSRT